MPDSRPEFILVHSPLVGPLTWEPVAVELRQRGWVVTVPELSDQEGSAMPYWQQHAEAVARGAAQDVEGAVSPDRPLVLAGHSGAGAILPAIAARMGRPVAAYLFVDAGLPHKDLSRLGAAEISEPQWGQELRALLEAGGVFPTWSEASLVEEIPDPELRRQLIAGLHPRGRAFFEEPIPVFAGWPDAPCAYLQLSPAYDLSAAQAQRKGWPVKKIEAGHFHMLVDPPAVASAMVELLRDSGLPGMATGLHIEHVAVWTHDLERLKAFYETYFQARAGEKYVNPTRGFQSYFLSFSGGARLELMQVPSIKSRDAGAASQAGFAHLAFAVGSQSRVDSLTEQLRSDGYAVLDGPRRTGDGYYESSVLDPDGNRIEITV